MKPFASPTQMLDAHEAMFGQADRQAVEIVLKWAPKLFAVPLDPLSVRVVRAVVAWLTATPEARNSLASNRRTGIGTSGLSRRSHSQVR